MASHASLRIAAHGRPAKPGDLAAMVEGDTLLVPEAVAHLARSGGLRTASELVSYMEAFPSAVASQLHWKLEDVTVAVTNLHRQLTAAGETLPESSDFKPSFGARDPALLKRRH